MEAKELLELIRSGESSNAQFKERLPHNDSLAQEMAAFSNSGGGKIVIGVNDKTGQLNGLSYAEIQASSQQLVNVASQAVFPPIFIRTETVKVDDHYLVVAEIGNGPSKPYKDCNGTIYMKNGPDKRKVTSNDEIARLLQSSKAMFADEIPVTNTSPADIDTNLFNSFLQKKYGNSLSEMGISLVNALTNLNLLSDNELTLAGLLLFGKQRERFKPLFTIQCVASSNEYDGNPFYDYQTPIDGNLSQIYKTAIGFIDRNMRKVPSGPSFNSLAVWEIPMAVFEELLVNALFHRNYFIQSTIKIFFHTNRIEIHSPGLLPNSLTVNNIKHGISVPRNPVLQSVGQYVLPYKGLGTGVARALSLYPKIDFINDLETEQFKVVIWKP